MVSHCLLKIAGTATRKKNMCLDFYSVFVPYEWAYFKTWNLKQTNFLQVDIYQLPISFILDPNSPYSHCVLFSRTIQNIFFLCSPFIQIIVKCFPKLISGFSIITIHWNITSSYHQPMDSHISTTTIMITSPILCYPCSLSFTIRSTFAFLHVFFNSSTEDQTTYI